MKQVVTTIALIGFLAITVLPPGSTGHSDTNQNIIITTDLYCIQINKSEMDDIEKTLGFHLNAPDGKVLLTSDERTKLLDALKNAESAEILGNETLSRIPGCSCAYGQSGMLEEIRYPIKYKLLSKGNKIVQAEKAIEKRKIGLHTNYTITDGPEPGLITIVCFIEMTRFLGWYNFNKDISQPAFKSWNQSMTIVIPNGMTYVSKQIAPTAFAESLILPSEKEKGKTEIKNCLFILGVKRSETQDPNHKP